MSDELTQEARTLRSLRRAFERTQKDLAAVLKLKDGSLLSQFENGHKLLSGEYLKEIAAALELPAEGVEALLFGHRLVDLARQGEPEDAADEEPSPLALTAQERQRIAHTAIAGAWTVAEVLSTGLARAKREAKVALAQQEAEEQWARLKPLSREERRDLVEVYPTLRNPALVARVCEASARAADAVSGAGAMDLADFALFVARQLPGEARRARAEGFCRAFLGNALRTAGDLDAAGAAFGKAWELWEAGDPREPELLPEWRLHALEAALRREQRRFPEALARLDRALELCTGEPVATARLLLDKEQLFETLVDTERAIMVLEEATPHVEATGDPHLVFVLRFKWVDFLCRLERFAEAEKRLPAVRELAIGQGNPHRLSRLLWLAAKIDAGQGRVEKAIANLEQVRQKWSGLPDEAALVSLDLAALYLKEGRKAELRRLALEMSHIFKTKEITREAQAELAAFFEAVRQDIVTAELIQQSIARVERVRRSAPPS
ncbi:MAG TPA: helix-turn-helix transcriptional regulator [Thermoanaerobaculia bacterium]|nr:helix-turn-helix transcriptional regulator [Thermoanaerobaculia bacterium]